MNKNKGFSLVELIIVIAIMAILVGVMAPQLIKFIEKSNVAADTQLCDDIHTAIMVAMMDPDVVNSDDGSDSIADQLSAITSGAALTSFGGTAIDNTFGKAIIETLGFDPFNNSCRDFIKSSPAKKDGVLSIYAKPDGGGFYIYIDHSDNSGKKQDISGVDHMDQMICSPSYVGTTP